MESAILALEDGTVFKGRSFGAPAERSGEVVFNTALTGYQEIFTDPSYSGQIVILTNPQIGNYGRPVSTTTKLPDRGSKAWWCENSPRSPATGVRTTTRGIFSSKNQIPVVSELDTRALVRHLRIQRRNARRPPLPPNRAATSWFARPAKFPPWPASISPAASPLPNATNGPKAWRPARPPKSSARPSP